MPIFHQERVRTYGSDYCLISGDSFMAKFLSGQVHSWGKFYRKMVEFWSFWDGRHMSRSGLQVNYCVQRLLLRILVLTNFMTKFVFKQLNFKCVSVIVNVGHELSWRSFEELKSLDNFPLVKDNFIKLNWVSLKRNIRSQKRFHITTTCRRQKFVKPITKCHIKI